MKEMMMAMPMYSWRNHDEIDLILRTCEVWFYELVVGTLFDNK
jgi:hypothetical protein